MTSVAIFLREKLGNMAAWLNSEGLALHAPLHERTNVEIVAFAQYLHDTHAPVIRARDFAGMLDDNADTQRILAFVESRPELHDKFWRYLALFSEVVAE